MRPGEGEGDTVGDLECEMQSREFFSHIGLLIVEGRVPQCSDKGRVEGTHCLPLFSLVSHVCDPAVDSTCQNILEKKAKMEQIWQNGYPMIITVLVCTPSRDLVLLEKWTVEVIDRMSAQTSFTSGNVLLQAIRSHIHFSQLSAWLSRSKGTIPSEIIYRICDSCELSPCGTFFHLPDSHVFPLASLQGNKALRVQVESLPRCEIFNFTEEILESKMNHLESNGISSCLSQQKELSEHSPDINDELLRSPLKKKTCLKSHETQQLQMCFENNFTNIQKDYSKPLARKTVIEEALQRTTRNCDSELLLSQSVFLENFRKKNIKYRSLSAGKAEDVQKEQLLNQCSNTNKLHLPSNGQSKEVAIGQNKQERICSSNVPISRAIPKCRQSLLARHIGSGTIPIFNSKTGLPVSSSPAPLRRSTTDLEIEEESLEGTSIFSGHSDTAAALLSKSAPASTTQSLLGNFEESVLNGRMEPLGTVEGFTAELNASGSFCPAHVTLPVEAHFFSLSDDNAPSPYLGYISLDKSAGISKKGYHLPAKGTVQLTLFNPNKTVVKMFVVLYDFSDMPPKAQTFLRQRTFSVWRDSCQSYEVQSSLHYLIHLRFASSKSGRLYLHTDIRLIFARQPPDLPSGYKLCTVTDGPTEPRYALKHELV